MKIAKSGARSAFIIAMIVSSGFAFAQSAGDLPVTRVSLFSSGVGFFLHEGNVSGNGQIPLLFAPDAVNDVLKSLVIHDPESTSPSVRYASEDTLERTLKSLKVDLSSNPDVAQVLAGLRGAEILLAAPDKISGRILGVERREIKDGKTEAYLSIVTPSGIRVIALSEVSTFSFTDPAIGADIARALDLILSSRDSSTREIDVNLPAKGDRKVSLGYVVPVPVWKTSYRIELSGDKSAFQGWAIVDNAGNMDWKDVQLSLVTGKPVSFVQNLYPPLYFQRPVLPLSIAGAAEAVTYDSGYGGNKEELAQESDSALMYDMMQSSPAPAMKARKAEAPRAGYALTENSARLDTAKTSSAGEMFLFTVAKPVSIARRQSAMIPLVETTLKAEKISVLSGAKVLAGGSVHPMLCASLVNTTGMKLPAGPITVFDEGSYAGDALIEFFPEGEKRIIAFGEDLSVSAIASLDESSSVTKYGLNKGTLMISIQREYSRKYTIKNSGSSQKRVVVEHPFIERASLKAPAKFEEKTDSLYRFGLTVAPKGESTLDVREVAPEYQAISLEGLGDDDFAAYARTGGISPAIKAALEKAAEFKKAVVIAEAKLQKLDQQRGREVKEQDRIRKNLEASGNETAQGKEYLKKLAAGDARIEKIDQDFAEATKAHEDAQNAFSAYLSGLTLE
ncbi:MAG TPA: hypothetical protein PKO22_00520 [Treponemataceae bacterium]|nr:hypothetical protein [Treponemataceae bacterium]